MASNGSHNLTSAYHGVVFRGAGLCTITSRASAAAAAADGWIEATHKTSKLTKWQILLGTDRQTDRQAEASENVGSSVTRRGSKSSKILLIRRIQFSCVSCPQTSSSIYSCDMPVICLFHEPTASWRRHFGHYIRFFACLLTCWLYSESKIEAQTSAASQRAKIGSDVSLWCNATGYPKPVVYWTRDDRNRRLPDGTYQFWVGWIGTSVSR